MNSSCDFRRAADSEQENPRHHCFLFALVHSHGCLRGADVEDGQLASRAKG
ncbi:MAG: hypothetical protein KME32_16195 [Mojavia pulchra JT2-VF2]|uniref:Uncharacterized protein n=1 Tax=Mojavia pulchra JT2-VF2 TaxID=287848 RepID=A0A951PZZ2_9NOST|nr:hypothetical protein [Mojavia pulchra JT2-VF2]